MSITETNINTIRFFNNNTRKLETDINKSILIIEEIHYLLYGVNIKLEKEKYLNIILSIYKELIYNKLFINNTNNQDNNWYYMELKTLICECHLENQFEKIKWYYKSSFSNLLNKLRIEKSNNEINDILRKHQNKIDLLIKDDVNNNVDIRIEELRDDINYDINLKLEHFEDNINYIINEKIRDLKLSLILTNEKKSYLMNVLLTIISITTIINFYY